MVQQNKNDTGEKVQHKRDGVPVCLKDLKFTMFANRALSAMAVQLTRKLQEVIKECYENDTPLVGISFRWQNVRDAKDNPDGQDGMLAFQVSRLTAVEQHAQADS